jgi:hypothetical protein
MKINFKSQKGDSSLEASLLMLAIFLVLGAIISLTQAIGGWSSQRTFVGHVDKVYVDGGNTYFVISEGEIGDVKPVGTVYENKDAWFFFKWNSGDILRDLNVGETYTFHTYGWRFPFWSWFPNIITATPIGQ